MNNVKDGYAKNSSRQLSRVACDGNAQSFFTLSIMFYYSSLFYILFEHATPIYCLILYKKIYANLLLDKLNFHTLIGINQLTVECIEH